ncbi:Yip1 family protein [Clostridium sp. Marseille-QA1073]
MKRCKNCDIRYDEDISFCKVCGKELEEDSSVEESTEKNEANNENAEVNGEIINEETFQEEIKLESYTPEENFEEKYSILNLIKGMFIRPFETMKGITEKLTSGTTWILLGIISIINSLFSAGMVRVVINRLVASLNATAGEGMLYGGMPYGFSTFANEIQNSKILSAGSIFCLSLVSMIIFALLITLCIYIMCKIFRSKNTYMDIFKIVTSSLLYYTVGYLILLLLILINANFIFMVAILATLMVAFFVSITLGLVNSLRVNKDRIIYIVSLGYMLNIIINNYLLEFIMNLFLRNVFMNRML